MAILDPPVASFVRLEKSKVIPFQMPSVDQMCDPLQNLGLAVRGFKAMLMHHSLEAGVPDSVLIMAGGYDNRLAENREHYEELVSMIAESGLQNKVRAVKSLRHARCWDV